MVMDANIEANEPEDTIDETLFQNIVGEALDEPKKKADKKKKTGMRKVLSRFKPSFKTAKTQDELDAEIQKAESLAREIAEALDTAEEALSKTSEDLQSIEKEVHAECEEFGVVEKITVFSKHPAGVMIVKFTQPNAASDAVNAYNGKVRSNGRKVEASYWDGVTDYTCRDVEKEEKETEKRLDEFGDWLENQELPEEFKLQVEE